MKPEEQVRADFEAYMTDNGQLVAMEKHATGILAGRYVKVTDEAYWELWQAAYAQARREALEECESICSRLWLRVDGSAHDCAKAIKDLIKD